MKRENKFKIWDHRGDTCSPIFTIEEAFKTKLPLSMGYGECYTIVFFIGLKDKNGVEIYDGDVLHYMSNDYEVFWNLDRWMLRHSNGVVCNPHDHGGWGNFEAIGSIHAPPES